MRRQLSVIAPLLIAAIVIGFGISLNAGGVLEGLDITGRVASPIPGQIVGRTVGIRWDVRSIPVAYRVNDTQDPIPNPLGEAFLSLADATTVLQQSLDAWNDIPTSYIQMDIVGTTDNPGLAGFDLVNELTFRTAATFGAIASSPSTSLIEDTEFADGTGHRRRRRFRRGRSASPSTTTWTAMATSSSRQGSTRPGRSSTTTCSSTPRRTTDSALPSATRAWTPPRGRWI